MNIITSLFCFLAAVSGSRMYNARHERYRMRMMDESSSETDPEVDRIASEIDRLIETRRLLAYYKIFNQNHNNDYQLLSVENLCSAKVFLIKIKKKLNHGRYFLRIYFLARLKPKNGQPSTKGLEMKFLGFIKYIGILLARFFLYGR